MAMITASPTESARFGIPVGRARLGATDESVARALREEFVSSEFELVVLRYPADSVGFFAELASHEGVRVLFADALVYFRWVDAGEGLPPAGEILPRAAAGALVEDMIERTFADYRNHYAANPPLDRRLVAAGYAEWARRVAADPGNELVVVLADGEPAGIAVIDSSSGEWDVVLAGVVPEHRGRGAYSSLVSATMGVARASGQPSVIISTQVHNVPVMRTWERLGWRVTESLLTVHLERR